MSTTIPGVDPVTFPALYDRLMLAGQFSPGRAKLNFPTKVEGWDKQAPKGSKGGETVHNGTPLIDFDCELYLWKDRAKKIDHFAAWEIWKLILGTPVAKNAQKALDIYHPQLDGLGITSVVVQTWTEPQPDGKGGATVKIKLLQYSPAAPTASGKPKGSTTKAVTADPDPNQDLIDKIAVATKELFPLGRP